MENGGNVGNGIYFQHGGKLGCFPIAIAIKDSVQEQRKTAELKFHWQVIIKVVILLILIPANSVNTVSQQIALFGSLNFDHVENKTQFRMLDFAPYNIINVTMFIATIAYVVWFRSNVSTLEKVLNQLLRFNYNESTKVSI